jgi:hypothetical protein
VSKYFTQALFNKQDDEDWATSRMTQTLNKCSDLLHDVFALMRNSEGVECNPLKKRRCDYHVHKIRDKVDQCPYGMDERDEYQSLTAIKILDYMKVRKAPHQKKTSLLRQPESPMLWICPSIML